MKSTKIFKTKEPGGGGRGGGWGWRWGNRHACPGFLSRVNGPMCLFKIAILEVDQSKLKSDTCLTKRKPTAGLSLQLSTGQSLYHMTCYHVDVKQSPNSRVLPSPYAHGKIVLQPLVTSCLRNSQEACKTAAKQSLIPKAAANPDLVTEPPGPVHLESSSLL